MGEGWPGSAPADVATSGLCLERSGEFVTGCHKRRGARLERERGPAPNTLPQSSHTSPGSPGVLLGEDAVA